MHIQAVDQTAMANMGRITSPAKVSREDVAPAKNKIQETEQIIASTPAETEIPVAGSVGDDGNASGVLRLLQEGHFRGVADVRLRINFADEIAAMEKEQTAQVAADGVTGLADLVNNRMESLTPENGIDEQTMTGIQAAADAFNLTLPQALSEYQNGSLSGSSELSARFQAGFDEFVSSVQAIIAPAPEPGPEITEGATVFETGELNLPMDAAVSVVDNEAPVEETPSFDFQAFIADLTEAFAAKLQELETTLDAVQVLPPLSEPHGNGGAYEKFLAIYNDMQGAPVSDSVQPVVDATV